MIFGLQTCKDSVNLYNHTTTPYLTPYFVISEIAKRCPYLLPIRKSEKKTQKISYFLLKSFADTEKSRTFASHLRNKDAYLRHRNPYITMLRSLIYFHVSVIEK